MQTETYKMDKQVKPRGKGIMGKTLGLKNSYKDFSKNVETGKIYKSDYKTYRAVCEEFNKKTVDDILLNMGEFELPYGMGSIRIQKKKMNISRKDSLRVDWEASKKVGKKVYFLNDHRDNHRYRWYWKKNDSIIINRTAYSFTACRANKRELARLLKTSKMIDYFE